VLREAFRVLKPGGRFAVSDMVLKTKLPEEIRQSVNLWTGCVAGALVMDDYLQRLENVGFVDGRIEPTRQFSPEDAAEMAGSSCCGGPSSKVLEELADNVFSAFIRARKPE